MLMGRANIAVFVGSLNALRRGSLLTVFLLFSLLALLLLAILAIVDYVLQTRAFPRILLVLLESAGLPVVRPGFGRSV